MMIRAIIDGLPCMLLQSVIHIYIMLFSNRIPYLRKQPFFVIIRCKCRQLIRENVVRRRYQHDFGIPVVHQFCQRCHTGVLHLFRVFPGIVHSDQIMIRSQIDPIDLFFPETDICPGLKSYPFIPSYELVGHVFLISIPVFSREKTLPGKGRAGSQHPVLRFRIYSVTVPQICHSQNQKYRTDQSDGQQRISFIIHMRFLLPGQNRKYKKGLYDASTIYATDRSSSTAGITFSPNRYSAMAGPVLLLFKACTSLLPSGRHATNAITRSTRYSLHKNIASEFTGPIPFIPNIAWR